MTTSDEQPQDPNTPNTDSTKKPKKSKSKGFIESTSFKPTWLETGPLSPDMLPPELAEQVLAETAAGGEPSDDLLDKLAELERLYGESGGDDAIPEAPAKDSDPEGEIAVESVTTPVAAVDDTGVTAEQPPVVDEAAVPLDAVSEAQGPPVDTLRAIEDEPLLPEEPAAAAAVWTEVIDGAANASLALDDDLAAAESEDLADASVAPVAVAPAPPPAAKPKPARQAKPKRKHPLFDRLARILLVLGLGSLGLAALTYFVNPFARIALGTAELARPAASADLADPATVGANWCVSGSFQEAGAAPLPMQDSGGRGDIVADDQVFGFELDTLPAGAYQWQVVDCAVGEPAYPAAASWIQVASDGDPVAFLFDSREHEDRLFFPIPFVVSAIDSTERYQVSGSFQGFNPDDPSAILQHLGGGVYQHVRRIARPDVYEAYIVAAGRPDQAIDAYGRTSEPIPFSFETGRSGDVVVFLLDTNRGRASVLYGMPRWATELAYGPAFRILSVLLGLLGLLLLGWMLLRMVMMGNDANWLDAGCPNCGRPELMRVSRKSGDRLLNLLGIPAYRYQCRNCTWMGTRLSEDGAPVSPGATIVVDRWR
jgi:hypothetical protein